MKKSLLFSIILGIILLVGFVSASAIYETGCEFEIESIEIVGEKYSGDIMIGVTKNVNEKCEMNIGDSYRFHDSLWRLKGKKTLYLIEVGWDSEIDPYFEGRAWDLNPAYYNLSEIGYAHFTIELLNNSYCIRGYEKGYSPNECCEGLTEIEDCFEHRGRCICPERDYFVCSTCGDGQCKFHENRCNCPEDCKISFGQKIINWLDRFQVWFESLFS